MQLFCFGFGYSAEALFHHLSARDIAFAGTRMSVAESGGSISGVRLTQFTGDAPSGGARDLLPGTTHILVSIPPDLEGDIVLRYHREDIAALSDVVWIGYLSTVGVYGDWQGEWVDESSPTRPVSERSLKRLQAEQAWTRFGIEIGRPVQIFRLAGIYGPGRSVIDSLRGGTARRIVKAGQVFNRVHVDDVARTLVTAMDKRMHHSVYNVCDDEPAPPEDVVAYAAELLGLPPPPEIPFETSGLSGMAAGFWAENKRVRNARIRHDLGVPLLYPTYREGLRALAHD